MGSGKKLVAGSLAVILCVPLAFAAFFLYWRQVGPTPAQAAALRVMREPTPPVQGNDASDAFWLQDFDVPPEKMAEVAAATRRFVAAADAAHPRAAPLRDPRAAYPRFADPLPRGKGSCPAQGNCLDYVKANRELVGADLQANQRAVDAALAVAAFDGFRLGMPERVSTEMPMPGRQRPRVQTWFAYRFMTADRMEAVDALCRDIGGWRRVGGNSDTLFYFLATPRLVAQDLELLADMLAKLPKEAELPPSCDEALAPSQDKEFDACPAARSQFVMYGFLRETVENAPPGDPGPPAWAIDWRNLRALHAADLARYCDPALVAQLRADRAVRLPEAPRCSTWRARGDPYGCTLAAIGRSDFTPWLEAREDLAQRLALMRTVVWLRTHAGDQAEAALALPNRPPELGLLREPAYDGERDRLSIPLHKSRLDQEALPRFELNAGAEPRPRSRPKRLCCSRRPSRNLAALD